MLWEYCTLVAVAHRPGMADARWSIAVWGNGVASERIVFEQDLHHFDRVYWLNLLGLRGWDLVDVMTDRVTFPGGSVGLKEGNITSLAYQYRFTFKRIMQRSVSDGEADELARLGL